MAEALAGKACPRCAYKRTAAETVPGWQCPSCGVAYTKAAVAAGAQAPQPASTPSGPVEAVLAAFKGYVDFSGRATRSEYWWFFLFCLLAPVPVAFINLKFGAVVLLAVMLPSISVMVRRLHDAGKSGWWWFIGFIPVAGPVILFYFAVQPSDGDNDYGTALA